MAPSVAPTSVLWMMLMTPGNAPELSWTESCWALSTVNPPLICPLPPQIASFTWASEIRSLSRKIAMWFSVVPTPFATSAWVRVQNLLAP